MKNKTSAAPAMPFFQCHRAFIERMAHEKLTTNQICLCAYLMSNLIYNKPVTRPTPHTDPQRFLRCSNRTIRRALRILRDLDYLEVLNPIPNKDILPSPILARMRIVEISRSLTANYYQRKNRGDLVPTGMPFFQCTAHTIKKMARKRLIPAECLIFFYLLTRVDVESGKTHHVQFSDIAKTLPYRRQTIKQSVSRLDSLKFIETKSIGFSIQADIQTVLDTAQISADAKAKREREKQYAAHGFADMHGRTEDPEIDSEIFNTLSPEVQKIIMENES